MPYTALVNHHKYILVPVIQAAIDTYDVTVGAHVYSQAGDYKGFWPIENMPDETRDGVLKYVEMGKLARVSNFKRIRKGEDISQP